MVNETVANVTGNATVGDALIHISDKLGIGIQEIYRIYISAQSWIAFQGIVSVSVFIAIFLIGALISVYVYIKSDDEYNDRDGMVLFALMLVTLTIALVISIGVHAALGFYGRSVVPEYYALQDLLHMLSQAM